MSDEVQAQETPVEQVLTHPVTRGFVQAHYDLLQRMVVLGMGYPVFEAAVANRMMSAIENQANPMQCWALFLPGEIPKLCGALTFFIATDAILGEKYMYIYSLHCTTKVALEAWRQVFSEIAAYAKSKGCLKICAKTQNDHVVEIARDNGFAFGTYLERGV